jgi:hypothetical protein
MNSRFGSTDARKIEKLRRKICLSVPMAQQREVKEALLTQMPSGELRRQKYEGRRQKETLRINARDLIKLLRIYFSPYLKAGALDRMAEHRGVLYV